MNAKMFMDVLMGAKTCLEHIGAYVTVDILLELMRGSVKVCKYIKGGLIPLFGYKVATKLKILLILIPILISILIDMWLICFYICR